MRRLSDDALKGIPMGGKKIRFNQLDYDGNTCFLGAAGISVHGSVEKLKAANLLKPNPVYPELAYKNVLCPIHKNKCDGSFGKKDIIRMSAHLNNYTDMTREEIAYWVREQEDEIIEGRKAKEVQVKEEVKDEAIIPTI